MDDHRPENATYVYCLVQVKPAARGAGAAPATRGAPRGLPGASRVRALDAGGGLSLIVADAPLDRYGAEPIERRLADLEWVGRCAVAHESVVEHFTGAGTVIPMKLFTLFASEARALARIKTMRASIDGAVMRLAHREEWGVRVSVDPQRIARGTVRETHARARGLSAGTRFLVRKQSARDAVRRALSEGRADVDGVFETLARLADDARRRTPVQDEAATHLVLDAAFLVPEKRRASFRAAVKRAATRLDRRGYEVTLTGPWPPYNFVGDPA